MADSKIGHKMHNLAIRNIDASSLRRGCRFAIGAAVLLCAAMTSHALADDREEQLVLYVQEQDLEAQPMEEGRGLASKILRQDVNTGALVLRVQAPLGWRDERSVRHVSALEIYILSGDLVLGGVVLGEGDFVLIPENTVYGAASSVTGAQFLMFFDGPGTIEAIVNVTLANDDSWTIVRDAETPWVPALVAQEAGVDLPLEVKNLKNDPISGARTFLVRSAAGVLVPWETHPVAEEGYLLEGSHRLEECLPTGLQSGVYEVGGYFYRPPELMHMGPGSIYTEPATWLIRTSGKLVDVFHDTCPHDQ